MTKALMVLVAACALLLTLGTAPAFADGLLPAPPSADQSVTNSTNQSNEAAAVNVPILSGNNVAGVNTGDQNASAGTTQSQENENATSQNVAQSSAGGCDCPSDPAVTNRTKQENEAVAVNVPIASGNNVALVNKGDQNASAGTTQSQENENATSQNVDQSSHGCGCSGDQSVSNSTKQENEAVAVNVPIASGNNVALINKGDQNASAGTTQSQSNENATKQDVRQSSGGGDQTVSNRTKQENEALAVNIPIASGNNVALVNKGDQNASAGTTQSQENENWTRQDVSQSSHGCGCSGDQTVSNRTKQENEAVAVNIPIASGNNVALVNKGDQNASAGTTQSQENENATTQRVSQSSSGGSGTVHHEHHSFEHHSQTAWAGTSQSQENDNRTRQDVRQSSHGCGCSGDQTVSNRTKQENEALAVNIPIASGNNVALFNKGDQNASAGTTQSQENGNATRQDVGQSVVWGSSATQSVRNSTRQENEALAVNVPILSGNNVALFNGGSQTASAGTTQSQENENATWQGVQQSGAACHPCGR